MSGTSESRALIPFGPFEADLASQELRKHGLRLRLPRQSFQILKMLLERPGQLVSREDMRSALWPSDTFVDFEHSLNAAINKLRETLGDDADHPTYIETLPKRGYRFIALKPAECVPPEPPPPAATKPPSPPQSSPPRRSLLKVAAALLIVLTLVIVILAATGWGKKLWIHSNPPPQIHSLAVLPLANLSGDPKQEYFADGMTEELITELSRISSLKVISQTSVMQYKGEKKKSLPQIGRELNVDALLEGSVLRSENRVRIVVHLVYVPADQTLMVETYERDIADILKLQAEVAEAVAQKVRLKLTPTQQARLRHAKEVNPQAYDVYLYGTRVIDPTFNGLQRAMQQFKKAVDLDPGYAPAYVALGEVYAGLGEYRWLAPKESFPQASQYLRQALELDAENCGAHQILAGVHWRYDWNWQATEREYAAGLGVCPNSVDLHWDYAMYLAWKGRKDEAFTELDKSRAVDPVQEEPIVGKAIINYHLRNYGELLEAARRHVARNPNVWISHNYVAVGLQGLKRTQEAIPEYRKAVELSQGDSDAVAALGFAYGATGHQTEAKAILRDLLLQSKSRYVSPYMTAAVYAGLGENNKAFEYLEKAYQERSPDLPWFLKSDLRLDGLRSDPRYQDLLRRMNFPQ